MSVGLMRSCTYIHRYVCVFSPSLFVQIAMASFILCRSFQFSSPIITSYRPLPHHIISCSSSSSQSPPSIKVSNITLFSVSERNIHVASFIHQMYGYMMFVSKKTRKYIWRSVKNYLSHSHLQQHNLIIILYFL